MYGLYLNGYAHSEGRHLEPSHQLARFKSQLPTSQNIHCISVYMTSARGKPLTAELVLSKTKADRLDSIKNLNLWGNDLEDLDLVGQMPNLEVISLSVNRISTLRFFAHCDKLQELYLRKNSISDLRQIHHLVSLPALKVLWLHDNPCAAGEGYRQIVIKYLPGLAKLDNNVVTPEEKAAAGKSLLVLGMPDLPQEDKKEVAQKEEIPKQKEEKRESKKEEYRISPKPLPKRPYPQSLNKQNDSFSREEEAVDELSRNKNILIAVLSLMKELDTGSIQIVRKEAEHILRHK